MEDSKLSQEEIAAIADAITANIHIHNCRCGLTKELIEHHAEDHRFIGEAKKGIRLIQKIGMVTTVTGIFTALGSAIVLGVKVMLMNGGK